MAVIERTVPRPAAPARRRGLRRDVGRDDEALAAAVEVALATPELGPIARGRARTYTPHRMAAGYLALYERLAVPEALEATAP